MNDNPAVQDHYDSAFAACYGCGAENEAGHQLKTRWDGDSHTDTITRFTPKPEHTALPGFVYGGLVASVIDCSGTGSAALAGNHAAGRDFEAEGSLRFVTGTLEVRYLKPTPMGVELVCRGHIDEVKGRKITVSLTLSADGVDVATGKVIALEAPDSMSA
ncbi:PaaI family thioesterase [Mariniluteicoccus endophyticus]